MCGTKLSNNRRKVFCNDENVGYEARLYAPDEGRNEGEGGRQAGNTDT